MGWSGYERKSLIKVAKEIYPYFIIIFYLFDHQLHFWMIVTWIGECVMLQQPSLSPYFNKVAHTYTAHWKRIYSISYLQGST